MSNWTGEGTSVSEGALSVEIVSDADLISLLKLQLSSLSTLITEMGYAFICKQTLQELNWAYPLTISAKIFWLVKRATRHALNMLRIASANKFKFKQVNLQHRFDHFQKLIEEMDKEFEEALTTDTALFAGVESFRMFGTKVDAGFAYDSTGRDITYQDDQYVNFAPLGDM